MSNPEYTRGYNKGRAKTGAEMAELRAVWNSQSLADKEFKRQVFLVALAEIMRAGNWKLDGKPLVSPAEHCAVAGHFVSGAVREMLK